MSEPAVIVIPMVPDRACSPNGGWSWRTRAKARAELRECARLATKAALDTWDSGAHWYCGYDYGGVVLDVEIAWCCGRKRMDDDNARASLKGAIDGIADALWFGEDRNVKVRELRQTRGNGTVTVTIDRAVAGEG